MAKEPISSAECDALLNELEAKLARLRALYEQYFLGIERLPPTTARKEVFRMVQRLEGGYIRNTAQKFRMRSLVQRFNSYKTYWNRIEKAIENGTHTRDVKRAQRNQKRHERADRDDGPQILELDLEEIGDLADFQVELEAMDASGDLDHHKAQSRRQTLDPADAERRKQSKLDEIRAQLGGAPAPTPAAAPPSAQASKMDQLRQRFAERKAGGPPGTDSNGLPAGGASMDKLRELAAHKQRLQKQGQQSQQPAAGPPKSQPRTIQRTTSSQRVIQRSGTPPAAPKDEARAVYNKLLAAKKKCNENTSGLTYESVKSSMAAQRTQLKKDRGAKGVDFKVVIKNGKAFLKPDMK